MIKELIMSGVACNIRLAAQLMKNITEEEFMVIVGEICNELENFYIEYEDFKEYYKKFDKGLFEVFNDFSFLINNKFFFDINSIKDAYSNKISYSNLITRLENVS